MAAIAPITNIQPVGKFRPTPLPKLQKAMHRPVLAIKIVKSFEIGNIKQSEFRFDRMLSECAAATLILGSQTKTAIVQLNMSELANDLTPTRAKTQDFDQVIYGNIQGQILYEIDHSCRFSYLYHANLLFTDTAVYKLVQGQTKPEPIMTF